MGTSSKFKRFQRCILLFFRRPYPSNVKLSDIARSNRRFSRRGKGANWTLALKKGSNKPTRNSGTPQKPIQSLNASSSLTGENSISQIIDCTSKLKNAFQEIILSSVIVVETKGAKENCDHPAILVCATDSKVHIFDFIKFELDAESINLLKSVFESDAICKVCIDASNFAVGMFGALATEVQVTNICDLRLAKELCAESFEQLKVKLIGSKDNDKRWLARPLPSNLITQMSNLHILANDNFMEKFVSMLSSVGDYTTILQFKKASQAKWLRVLTGELRRPVFFNPNQDFALSSLELQSILCCGQHDLLPPKVPEPISITNDIDLLLILLPKSFTKKLRSSSPLVWKVRDIVMDFGQRPYLLFSKGREFLCDEESVVVTQKDMEDILFKLEGKFGPDNRAGFDCQLHRISAMRNRQGSIYSLTMRVGRSIRGNADMIDDILFDQIDKPAVLILGRPGCGKTTIIREIARKLSQASTCEHVVIVDTSNEIAGDGDIVHPSVGLARRMMVPNIKEQERVMIETLQNHTPDIIIIDEIGRPQEVGAAKTVKERDVRIFASAHGNLHSLVRNPQLNGLVGGMTSVTLGDATARESNQGNKVKSQRAGAPIFDVVVELEPGQFDTWSVVKNVGKAVDDIIEGKGYDVEVRSRDAHSGQIYVHNHKKPLNLEI